MQVGAVDGTGGGATVASAATKSAATSAFGLGFDSLLKIILTQLTYQDPLKPMDNFQFVSQLAQFSQIQLGQTTNDSLSALVSAQGALQATGLLGREVDVSAEDRLLTGRVVAVSLADGTVRLTIKTGDDETISGLALGGVVQVREIN